MRTVCLLGASGSIGSQTIDVMLQNPDDFKLVAFSVGDRVNKIENILVSFPEVKFICVKSEKDALKLKEQYPDVTFYNGDNGLLQLIESSEA